MRTVAVIETFTRKRAEALRDMRRKYRRIVENTQNYYQNGHGWSVILHLQALNVPRLYPEGSRWNELY